MIKKKDRAAYYEQTDFSSVMQKQKGRRLFPNVKRITLNISERIYQEAHELDSYMSMGYQNVLKTAMTLGLTELQHKVASHKTHVK
jgi:hypothetical protein